MAGIPGIPRGPRRPRPMSDGPLSRPDAAPIPLESSSWSICMDRPPPRLAQAARQFFLSLEEDEHPRFERESLFFPGCQKSTPSSRRFAKNLACLLYTSDAADD